MTERVLVIGAGGFSKAVVDTLRSLPSLQLAGFLDDRPPDELLHGYGGPVIGPVRDLHRYRGLAEMVVIAIGNTAARAAIFEQARSAGFTLPALVHPRAYVANDVRIGQGVIVMAGAVIGASSTLGDGCLVNAGAVLDHDCVVGRFAHIGIAASMGGGAHLAEGGWLRQGQTLQPEHQ